MSVKDESLGFSLPELAIVLVVIGLLVGGMLMPLATQIDLRRTAQTRRSLQEARDALLGFAVANGRLPCPAAAGSGGAETSAGPCPLSAGGVADGFLPGVTLGLSPSDSLGYVLDAWGNRLRYAVSAAPAAAPGSFTSSNGISNFWRANGAPPAADLQICWDSVSISRPGSAKADCAAGSALSRAAVAVIYSTGRNTATSGRGPDEAANLNGDRVFVAHAEAPEGASGGEFDDLLIWLSPNILYNRMVAAGRLP
ncbi:hypothetical protein GALL_161910 [mine drainage metagenome]|uniref:Type II secretion system protein G n=1 Tax=mine drainage metagenome TaxID=410659 RepID=A0A1J5RZV9_9ZZZZ